LAPTLPETTGGRSPGGQLLLGMLVNNPEISAEKLPQQSQL